MIGVVWYYLTHPNCPLPTPYTIHTYIGGPNPAESTSARPSLVTANASPSMKKSATPAASPIKNMKGSDYNALIKAKNVGSSTSFKKKDYNDLVKEKKAQAKAAALAQQ